ncbi:MAG: hypothetical protein PHH36_00830 [Sideroxydans sp.]|nr:hypothetical protein [Sideroxydans sp.]
MNDTVTQAMQEAEAANAAAQRIVRHFQGKGFTRITEAMILHIRHIAGERAEVDEAFEVAHKQGRVPPLSMYFTIHSYGHYSEFRSFDEAKAALGNDFTLTLIHDIPQVFFEPAPVMADDPLATGTKYDVIMKVWDNVEGCAIAILLNDPDASFVDYIGTHPGAEWQKIMGDLVVASTSLSDAFSLD